MKSELFDQWQIGYNPRRCITLSSNLQRCGTFYSFNNLAVCVMKDRGRGWKLGAVVRYRRVFVLLGSTIEHKTGKKGA